jgi:hypothetical protein
VNPLRRDGFTVPAKRIARYRRVRLRDASQGALRVAGERKRYAGSRFASSCAVALLDNKFQVDWMNC